MTVEPADLLAAIEKRFAVLHTLARPWWVVGGTVRDAVLGLETKDLDLVSPDPSRTAGQIAREWGGRPVNLGRELVVSRIVGGDGTADVAPIVGGDISQDLARRDFSINAMALGSDGSFLDPFGGLDDIRDEVIRIVDERNLIDDPLRILRAARFHSTLAFDISDETLDACRRHAHLLANVAGERIAQELNAALDLGDPPRLVKALSTLRIDVVLFGAEIDASTAARASHPNVVLGAIAWKVPEGTAEKIIHMRRRDSGIREMFALAGFVARSGSDSIAIPVRTSGREAAAQAAELLRLVGREAEAERIELFLESPEIFRMNPFLDGTAVMSILGVGPGPVIGQAASAVFTEQLEGRISSREEAITWLEARREDFIP
ncbi:MAG: hypothetical protein KY459_11055 [Acidobacteria bacterium]|nr:hypothetical protein [Acidobacteriota bacterium]